MADLEKLVTIKLDKERSLRLTLEGMLEFEKLTGKNLLKGFKIDSLTLSDTAAIIWACLLHGDKELTYDRVILMVDISNISNAMDAVKRCLEQSLSKVKAGERPLMKNRSLG